MDPILVQNLLEVQSNLQTQEAILPLAPPARALQRTYPGAPYQDDFSDSERTKFGSTSSENSSGTSTPRFTDDEDLEKSSPHIVVAESDGEHVDAVQSVWDPYMNRFRFVASCLMNFANALNDSAAGALIPYMEKYYGIGYAVVSLIFVGQALGFIFAAIFLDTLRARLGRAKLLALSQAMFTCAYIPLVVGSPFGLNVAAFFFVGFSIAINLAIGNIFSGGLKNSTLMLGIYHGMYGIGGTTGPLIATAIVTVANAVWIRYYTLTLGMGVITLCLSTWAFWGYEREQSGPSESEATTGKSALRGMITALKLRVVLLGSIFIFAYQGAEVSISGWVISFLINTRGGDPSSVGYVSAGFWAGITIGRFFLTPPAQKVGEKIFVYGLVIGALVFQLLVWFVPNIIGDAVAVSIVGLLLGPVYPCSAAVFMRSMTKREALSGMGTISACGSLGGALAPFVTGMLAQAVGTWVLHPIAIALFVVMLVCWFLIPSVDKKKE